MDTTLKIGELFWRACHKAAPVFYEEVSACTTRTPILRSVADVGMPTRYAREAAERIPNAKLHIIEGARHWTQRDYPEEVNRVIVDFLQGKT
jgi:pimeloyl-ACP methyl ester carboxylesterase